MPNLIKKGAFKGSGTIEDPYTLIDSPYIPYKIFLRKIDFYLKIENMEFQWIDTLWCKNVVITNCQIKQLRLAYSTELSINNNSIQELLIEKCQGNIFKNNHLSQEALDVLRAKQKLFPYEAIYLLILANILSILGIWMLLVMLFAIGFISSQFGSPLIFSIGIFVFAFSIAWISTGKKIQFYNRVKNRPNAIINTSQDEF